MGGVVNVKVTDSSGNSATKSASWQIANSGTGYPMPAVPAGWKTQVYENFTTTSLDTTKWTANVGTTGSPREQYYKVENVQTGNGLDIITKRENYGGRTITSGYITSANKMTFPINSRVNIRATVPDLWDFAAGIWPALWFRWPGSGEADLMEGYGYPFLNPARTNASENAAQRGNFSATTHNDTNGSPAKIVTMPANKNPTLAPGVAHVWGFEITDTGICYYFDGVPIVDAYGRKNPMTWADLAAKGINKSSFAGNGHVRIETQVGSGYWGPSSPTATKLPVTFHVDYVHILNKV